jgi:hypothetical protein
MTLNIAKEYTPAIRLASIEQVFLLFISALILDCGEMFRHFAIASIAFWAGTALILLRRPHTPTRTDIHLIQLGYFVLIAITLTLSGPICHYRTH